MKDPFIIFLYGFPASGKTTFANWYILNHPNFVLVGADKIREELYGSQDIYGDSNKNYSEILFRVRQALNLNQNVLYDGTNLKKEDRIGFLKDLHDIKCQKEIICIQTPKDLCIERHKNRGRSIPLENLYPYFDINEPPEYSEGWDKITLFSGV